MTQIPDTPTAEAPRPERALELAGEAWMAFDMNALVAHLSAAIRGFTARGDHRQAAMTCVQLGTVYANFLGNLTAGRAWYRRASRLVADEPPCIEQGWVAVAAMGCEVDDPEDLLARTELALDRARRFGNLDLEAKALADGGLAHVRLGRIEEGMALLDEAMALVCGPAEDLETASKSVCSFFTACYATADYQRAGSWNPLLREHGLIGEVPGPAVFLRSHCDAVQATLLFEVGRWSEAEALLERSIADFEFLMRGAPPWHPSIALADLRIRQGRIAEAEMLLLGKDAWMEGLLPATRLHVARGDHLLALATARRGLRAIGTDRMRAAELLGLTVESHVALGDLDAATEAADEMDRRMRGVSLPVLAARSGAARAVVHRARGDVQGAIALLTAGLDEVASVTVPWLRATLLLDLARCREETGDRVGAVADARAAAAVLASLDVVLSPEHAEVLDRLGAPPGANESTVTWSPAVSPAPSSAPSPALSPALSSGSATLTRDGKWWAAAHGSTVVRIADSKGMRYLAELVASPGVERHALDLVDRIEGVARPGEAPDRRRLGDAGEMLDSRARAEYRQRVEELRAEVDDAIAADDLDRAESLQTELDQFVTQLARAFGLGGTARRASSAVERARLNVTRALRAATTRLVDALPGAGAALDRHVRTGTYCVYDPPVDDPIRWIVQS